MDVISRLQKDIIEKKCGCPCSVFRGLISLLLVRSGAALCQLEVHSNSSNILESECSHTPSSLSISITVLFIEVYRVLYGRLGHPLYCQPCSGAAPSAPLPLQLMACSTANKRWTPGGGQGGLGWGSRTPLSRRSRLAKV